MKFKTSSLFLLGSMAFLAGCQTTQGTINPSSIIPTERKMLSQSISDWFPRQEGQKNVLSVSEEFLLYHSLAHLSQETHQNISRVLHQDPTSAKLPARKSVSLLPPHHNKDISVLPYRTQDIQVQFGLSKDRILAVSEIYETLQVLMASEAMEKSLNEALTYYQQMQIIFQKAAQDSLQNLERKRHHKIIPNLMVVDQQNIKS